MLKIEAGNVGNLLIKSENFFGERDSRNFCVDKGKVINICQHLRVNKIVLFSFFS